MTYAEKLLDPRWQKKRLEVLERDKFTCQGCGDTRSTLHVHHFWYNKGADPWNHPMESLITYCERCHQEEQARHLEAVEDLMVVLKKKGFPFKNIEELTEMISEIGLVSMRSVFRGDGT